MTHSAHVETLRGRRGCALWLPVLALLLLLGMAAAFPAQAGSAVATARAILVGAGTPAATAPAAATGNPAPDYATALRDYRYSEGVALRVAPDPLRSADVLRAFAVLAAPPALDEVAAEVERLHDAGQYVEMEVQSQVVDYTDGGFPLATALASETRVLRTFHAASNVLLNEHTVSGQVAYELEYTDRWRVTRAVDVAP